MRLGGLDLGCVCAMSVVKVFDPICFLKDKDMNALVMTAIVVLGDSLVTVVPTMPKCFDLNISNLNSGVSGFKHCVSNTSLIAL